MPRNATKHKEPFAKAILENSAKETCSWRIESPKGSFVNTIAEEAQRQLEKSARIDKIGKKITELEASFKENARSALELGATGIILAACVIQSFVPLSIQIGKIAGDYMLGWVGAGLIVGGLLVGAGFFEYVAWTNSKQAHSDWTGKNKLVEEVKAFGKALQ